MIDTRDKRQLWPFKRIISRKVNVEEENAALIRRIRWAHDRRLPMEEILANRAGRALIENLI